MAKALLLAVALGLFLMGLWHPMLFLLVVMMPISALWAAMFANLGIPMPTDILAIAFMVAIAPVILIAILVAVQRAVSCYLVQPFSALIGETSLATRRGTMIHTH